MEVSGSTPSLLEMVLEECIQKDTVNLEVKKRGTLLSGVGGVRYVQHG